MSTPGAYRPKGPVHYAMELVLRFRLPKASALVEAERIIRAAIDEELKTRFEREALGCPGCGIVLLRWQTLREELRDCCPECRRPMETTAALDRKRVLELEAALGRGGPGSDKGFIVR